LKRRILLALFANARDVYENPQLQVRDFWVNVEHPELEDSVSYCGPLLKLSEVPLRIRRRPPLIGEHDEYVYKELLGFSDDEVANMLVEGVITTEADVPEFEAAF